MDRPYHQQHQAPPLPPPPLPSKEERKATERGGSGSKRSGGGSGDSYDSRDDTVGHYGGKAGDWIDGRCELLFVCVVALGEKRGCGWWWVYSLTTPFLSILTRVPNAKQTRW